MKPIQLSCILLFCLLMAGCGVEEERATAVPTRVAVVTNTAVPPTPTPLPATGTAVPSPTNTATSLPATAVPTETPTITPTPLPPPPGEIYFFLDPDSRQREGEKFAFNFYRAIPGTSANEWQIETLLTGMSLEGPAITVSPDETKLALLLLDDTDGDGNLVANVGGDIRNIYIYDLVSQSIYRLTNNEISSLSVSWLPDSQSLTFPQRSNIYTTHLDGSSPQLTLQLPDNHIGQLSWSPDGRRLVLQAIEATMELKIYTPDSSNLFSAYELKTGTVLLRWWSPDGKWLALTHYGGGIYGNWRYIALMNIESSIVSRLVFGDDYMSSPPDWSNDSQWLAFTKNESILSLWSSETLTVTDVLSGTNMSIPVWSPLENRLAVSLVEDGIAKVLTFDPQAYAVTEVFQSEIYHTVRLFDWSPDGEWLLLFAANEDQSGLYVVHMTSGISYQVMDTTGGEPPWELVWLPTP
jgi:Tol biopolymer transport system component